MGMRFTYQQLRVFEAVSRRLSFTRAAEELRLTQPTVSLQVKQLADEVGMPLFEQVGRQVRLTEAGEDLRRTVLQVFDAWQGFEQRVDERHGLKRGTLRLAVATAAKYEIPELLGGFCRLHPEVDVRLEIANSEQLLERLADDLDHLYVMSDAQALPPGVTGLPFRENALRLVAPRDHPLCGQGRVPLSRLATERFIVREPGSGTRQCAEAFFRAQGFAPDVRMELGSNEAIKHAVAAGLGVSVLASSCLDVDPMIDRLCVLDVEGFPVPHRWLVVHPARRELSVVARAFLRHLGLVDGRTAATSPDFVGASLKTLAASI